MKKFPTAREIDEKYASPELLKYNVVCYKCDKKPKECECDDKWRRLHHWHSKLLFARLQLGLGYASEDERKLVYKHGW